MELFLLIRVNQKYRDDEVTRTQTRMITLIQSPMLKILVSFYLLCSLGYGLVFEGEESTENLQFHTVQLSSMKPSSTCIPSNEGFGEGTYLKLVHKHGPCSPLFQKGKGNILPVFESLKLDQSRIDDIQSKIRKPDVVTFPTAGSYVVTVAIGTPKKEVSLSFDTGSFLTWTQCKGRSGHYFRQKHPLYEPLKSKTFTNIKCSSPLCPDHKPGCSAPGCGYSYSYADNSSTAGVLGKERLTLTASDVIDNFFFGCGINNTGLFHELEDDGILGLSQSPLSIVQQTANKYHQIFSYCIPSKPSVSGFLRFGGGGRKSLVYTPITKIKNDTSSYGINLIGIELGGKKLPIPKSLFTKTGSIIDSGTSTTRLKYEIYKPLRDAYRKAMSRYLLVSPKDISPSLSIFDTCHFLGHQKSFKIPKLRFLLSGGVAVDIPTSGIALQILPTVVCFPLSDKGVGDGPMIWGNFQQKTLEVVYDIGRRKLGFGYGACK